MHRRVATKAGIVAWGLLTVLTHCGPSWADDPLWLEPRCKPLPSSEIGPFVLLGDGRLLTVRNNAVSTSDDGGATWSKPWPIYDSPKPGVPSRGVLLRTREGAIVLVYMDFSTQKGIVAGWDAVRAKPPPGGRRAVWAIRSLDDGKTWIDRQKIFEGYCGALINIIQTRGGKIVAPVQRLLLDPGRNGQATYVSADQGKTWTRSNVIDIGGRGFEDGAFEGTVAELSDGRLLMLMRTTLDYFWKAYSDDEGLSWREIGPSRIDASNSPGYLFRLASGRLVLVWNRLAMEGKPVRRGSKKREKLNILSHHERKEVSWQRSELSIAFSEDDGQTWTKPVVIARSRDAEVRYPCIIERVPDELWLTTRFRPHVRARLKESDFVGKQPTTTSGDSRE